MVSGNMNAFQIENLMDNEIETHHHEASVPASAIAKLGDGLPAFGIVAAVMGVVHTMESVGAPPAELGILIAARWSAPSSASCWPTASSARWPACWNRSSTSRPRCSSA
jgi:hypothetical protein